MPSLSIKTFYSKATDKIFTNLYFGPKKYSCHRNYLGIYVSFLPIFGLMKLNTSQWEYLTQFARSLLIRSGEIRFNYTDPSDLISAAFLNLKDQEVTIIQLQKEIRKEFYKQRNERASNKKHFIDTSANDHKACPKCRITFAAMEFKPRINKHGILVYNGYCPGCTADYQRYWRRTEKGRE